MLLRKSGYKTILGTTVLSEEYLKFFIATLGTQMGIICCLLVLVAVSIALREAQLSCASQAASIPYQTKRSIINFRWSCNNFNGHHSTTIHCWNCLHKEAVRRHQITITSLSLNLYCFYHTGHQGRTLALWSNQLSQIQILWSPIPHQPLVTVETADTRSNVQTDECDMRKCVR